MSQPLPQFADQKTVTDTRFREGQRGPFALFACLRNPNLIKCVHDSPRHVQSGAREAGRAVPTIGLTVQAMFILYWMQGFTRFLSCVSLANQMKLPGCLLPPITAFGQQFVRSPGSDLGVRTCISPKVPKCPMAAPPSRPPGWDGRWPQAASREEWPSSHSRLPKSATGEVL